MTTVIVIILIVGLALTVYGVYVILTAEYKMDE